MPVEMEAIMPDTLEELRVLERAIEREWWWLNGALHAVAQAHAERSVGKVQSFREMQSQTREVDRKRVAIVVRIAEVEAGLNALAQPH
jgi:hypothetical protein